eukprot:53909-Eustigmatos_ZCMA.PRE.1
MAVTATASTAASPLQQAGQTSSSSPSPRPDRTLENLRFDNLALRALPIDKVEKNHVRQGELKMAHTHRIRLMV